MNDRQLDRFLAKIEATPSGCWIWIGARQNQGYGWVNVYGRTQLAHRVSYEYFVSPVPPDLVLDHLCFVRACVNPTHLDPVSQAENVRRYIVGWKTHCTHGHELTADNIYRRSNRPNRRECRTCILDRERRKRQRAAA